MLKKCVVIMALFALVTGAVFAQATFGGQLQEGLILLQGNNVIDDPVNMGGTGTKFHEGKLSVLFGDATAGGRLVYEFNTSTLWGWMAWRPNEYFRMKIGSDGDGEWGIPQIVGWGFTGEAKNSVGAVSDYNGKLTMRYRNNGLNYGGYDGNTGFHLGLSTFLLDGMLQINLLFRDFDSDAEISEKLAKMHLIASYKIEEIGTIRFAAVGNGGLMKDAEDGADIGTLWLAFHSSELVQGLGFELGGNFNLPRLNQDDTFNNINVAAGINLTSTDPFNLKVRTNIAFGGKDAGVDRTTGWGIGLLPSYKLPKLTVFFHCGLGMEFPDGEDAIYQWFINPYIWVPMGSMRMWVGLQIEDEHTGMGRDGYFNWRIPFGFNFYF